MPLVREIPFDGYVFRSKAEAKWYKLFKELGIECHYEPETFALPFGGDRIVNYLPDFFLPEQDCYVEVKLSTRPTHEECVKAFGLAQDTGKDVFIVYEEIGKKRPNGYRYDGGTGAFHPLQRLTQCPLCKAYAFTHLGMVGPSFMKCGCACKELRNDQAADIQRAIKAVRAERFGA